MQQAAWLSICLFLGMVVCLELGYRIGLYSSGKNESAHAGTGTVEAAVFALLGLLLGFTFANGISHLDQRRELIVKEANTIGTAYLRLDLLPADAQPEMRHLFREYLDARLNVYQKLPDLQAADQELAARQPVAAGDMEARGRGWPERSEPARGQTPAARVE